MDRSRHRAGPDPVRLEVFHHLLAGVCEEAGALLQRSAVSPNIRERRDFSCALFDDRGRLVAQAAHIPVHLGSAADSVRAVREVLDLEPGDVVLLNDPYAGGTHLPDVTMVRPVFEAGRVAFFVVNRAHHADIGGAVPGSMGVARELLAEGLVVPPVKLRRAGRLDRDVLGLIAANVRGADERIMDLRAQEASLERAEARLRALLEDRGAREVARYCEHLMDHSERIARRVVAELRPGTYHARDVVEDDGLGGGPFPVRLTLRVGRDGLAFDFTRSAPQARGGLNANRSVVLAACVYVFRCLCPERLATNDGLFRVVSVRTRRGTIVDPTPGAAVAGGNVETSQRLVDVALRACARALPARVPAASAGTMSNLAIGARDPRAGRDVAYYETLAGGAGAGPSWTGTSAVQTHMTNTRNTPIEEVERTLPLRVVQHTVRRGSGGRGRFRGGDGLVKEIEALAPMTVSLLAERHLHGPPGLAGGEPGRPGRAWRVRDGRRRRMPSKGTFELDVGEGVRVETPGGGGWGRRPRTRRPKPDEGAR